ncbi:hypothetical protein FRB95_005412 [Tulasnella sp. JGI-2019a]|nr:hypothetical protein FRB95_005412 [Tulasnella sp. JGI-2019a]
MVYGRNVTVWDPSELPPKVIAGCNQHGDISIATFYNWLQIIMVTNDSWHLFYTDEHGLQATQPDPLNPKSTELLNPGHYIVLSIRLQPIPVTLTSERYRPRTVSRDITGTNRTNAFRERVRARDQRCCVTGQLVCGMALLTALQPYLRTHGLKWSALELSRCITDDANESDQGPDSINSIQNGLLMRADVHAFFDDYQFGIDPDDNYKITEFAFRGGELNGRQLFTAPHVGVKYRPSPELLREQFRQCILANVRGTGRAAEDFFDEEEVHDLSNTAVWTYRAGGDPDQPSWIELEVRSRLLGGGFI